MKPAQRSFANYMAIPKSCSLQPAIAAGGPSRSCADPTRLSWICVGALGTAPGRPRDPGQNSQGPSPAEEGRAFDLQTRHLVGLEVDQDLREPPGGVGSIRRPINAAPSAFRLVIASTIRHGP